MRVCLQNIFIATLIMINCCRLKNGEIAFSEKIIIVRIHSLSFVSDTDINMQNMFIFFHEVNNFRNDDNDYTDVDADKSTIDDYSRRKVAKRPAFFEASITPYPPVYRMCLSISNP